MYVKIGNTTYTKVSNLSFVPETDVAGTKIPVNEFTVNIYTQTGIRNGAEIELYDDLNNIWAKYWIVFAERLNQEIVTVRAQSKIMLLERRMIPAALIEGVLFSDLLSTVFQGFPSGSWQLDSSFGSTIIDGYHPEMSARDLLLWLCFSAGAYVKTFFTDKIEILPVDHQTEVTIPLEKTYYKPAVGYNDYVTAISITSFSFASGTPQVTDEWVSDNDGDYIVSRQEHVLANPNVPQTAPENIMYLDDVMLVNSTNVDDILSRLGRYYFNRVYVDLEAINNAEFMPGQKLVAYQDEDIIVRGYAISCDFAFGLQAKSNIRLIAVDTVPSGSLVILYKQGNTQIGKRSYSFPVGYVYAVQNPYIDARMNNHRYVYRPENEYATGTMVAGTNTNTQPCQVALDLDLPTKILHIISVDEVTVQSSDDIVVGVIS